MAAYDRGKGSAVEDQLFDQAFKFDFYQAVKIIEILYPEKTPVGEGFDPGAEPARFRSNVTHSFPASAVFSAEHSNTVDDQVDLTVNFMGLAGANSPLPATYTDLIHQRAAKKDTAFKSFLDLFNHRLISLMYRVRKTYRIGFPHLHPDETHFARYFFSLMGLGAPWLENRMSFKDRALLEYTGLMARQPRSMCGLELLLSGYFETQTRGRQFVGGWLRLDDNQVTRIGRAGQNQVLGRDAVLGDKVWDMQSTFSMRLGPMSYEKFLEFLPIGSAYGKLCEMTRFYSGDQYDFSFELLLEHRHVPAARLGTEDGARLGWNSWLGRPPKGRQPGLVKIDPQLLDKLKMNYGIEYGDGSS